LKCVSRKTATPSQTGRVAHLKDQSAAQMDGARGALWLPSYLLRRDATALGLLLLSMLDITSSFLRMAIGCEPPGSDKSMA
jgi:hypothetical protein